MARAAVKAKQAQRAKAQPAKAAPRRGRRRHASGGNPNQQLFFMRMRRQAKFMYAILAVLFFLTFAFLGVGSGSSGLEGLFNNINIFGGGNKTSVSKALKQVGANPRDPQAYRNLATAYEAKGDTQGAVGALQQYTTLKPKAVKVWTELAGLQMTQAQSYQSQYAAAYQERQLAAPSASFLPTGKLGTALGSSPIEQAAAQQANTTLTDLYTKTTQAYGAAIASYKKLAALQPANSAAQFQLAQAAQTAGDTTTAVAAYKAYLKLNPNSPNADQINALIKQLSPVPPAPAKKSSKGKK